MATASSPGSTNAPIKIYVGTQPEQWLAVRVLEYSISQHTQMPVQVQPLYEAIQAAGLQIPMPANPALRPRTPFSFQRFAIPQLCHYQGRAIYLDSDMQVFRDIDRLWSWAFDGADLLSVEEPANSGRAPQFSVMVLNCAQLDWDVVDLVHQLEAGRWTYQQFVLEMAPAATVAAVLPSVWNDLERHQPGETALTHYTDMDTQPWLTVHNPLAQIWCRDLLAAVSVGYLSRAAVAAEVKKGFVRPSLLYQIDHQIEDPQNLPRAVVQADRRSFVPPHVLQRLSVLQPSVPLDQIAWFTRWLRQGYAHSRLLLNRYP